MTPSLRRISTFTAAPTGAGGPVKTFYMLLATVAVVAIIGYLLRLRLELARGAERKRARRSFLERENERDRRACLSAAKSLDSTNAPRDAFALPGGARRGTGAQAGESPADGAERRRRAASSTAFDPDLPGA